MQSATFTQRLGHVTWQFLSTMIEGYPSRANVETQENMRQFIYLLAQLYPCNTCRNEFLEYVQKNKPRTEGREELFQYLYILRYIIDTDKYI